MPVFNFIFDLLLTGIDFSVSSAAFWVFRELKICLRNIDFSGSVDLSDIYERCAEILSARFVRLARDT